MLNSHLFSTYFHDVGEKSFICKSLQSLEVFKADTLITFFPLTPLWRKRDLYDLSSDLRSMEKRKKGNIYLKYIYNYLILLYIFIKTFFHPSTLISMEKRSGGQIWA